MEGLTAVAGSGSERAPGGARGQVRVFRQRMDRLSGLCRTLDLDVDADALDRMAGAVAPSADIVRLVAAPEEHTADQIGARVAAWVGAAVDAGIAAREARAALEEVLVTELLIERSSLGDRPDGRPGPVPGTAGPDVASAPAASPGRPAGRGGERPLALDDRRQRRNDPKDPPT
ncbi:hypothetical protein [Actinomadura fibrosa]|uniref:Uncharacterized protein n=1 Tax=Actinomadura fibrosa TaxID=111802 RepID=A0ABW2XED1_9ACTN